MKLLAVALLAVALAPLLAAEAQPEGKVYRVGLLAVEAPTNPRTFPAPLLDALAELGYVAGKNLRVEARYAERKFERLAELASELVRSQVDAIVATTGPAILVINLKTAKARGLTIPPSLLQRADELIQ